MRDYRRLYGAAMVKLAAEAAAEEKKEAPADTSTSAGAKVDSAINKIKGYGNKLKGYGNQAYGATRDFFTNPNHLKRMGFGLGGGVIGALIGGPKHRILGALLGSATGVGVGDLVAEQSYIRDGIASLKSRIARNRLLKDVGMSQEEFDKKPTGFYRKWEDQMAEAASAKADTDLLASRIIRNISNNPTRSISDEEIARAAVEGRDLYNPVQRSFMQ